MIIQNTFLILQRESPMKSRKTRWESTLEEAFLETEIWIILSLNIMLIRIQKVLELIQEIML